eukprot:6212570-Pleurochrysis_carterae.AAC.4
MAALTILLNVASLYAAPRLPVSPRLHDALRSQSVFMNSPVEERGDASKPTMQLEIERRLQQRFAGLAVGSTFLASATALAASMDMFDPTALLAPLISLSSGAMIVWAFNTLSFEESRPPLEDSNFKVKASPGKGNGLYAASPIAKGTFIFDYRGEVLKGLDELFARYADGGGAYVACINANLYIDGADPKKSNLARYMNHARKDPNVQQRKQRYGPNPAMHFYARRDIAAGEELTFDYGDEYWEALKQTPVD